MPTERLVLRRDRGFDDRRQRVVDAHEILLTRIPSSSTEMVAIQVFETDGGITHKHRSFTRLTDQHWVMVMVMVVNQSRNSAPDHAPDLKSPRGTRSIPIRSSAWACDRSCIRVR